MTTINKDSLTIRILESEGFDMWQGITTALIKVQELAIRFGDERVDDSTAYFLSILLQSLVATEQAPF